MSLQTQVPPTSRPLGMTNPKMFLRMLLRASLAQPGRVAGALMAVLVAATVATAMMTLYVDVQSKLQREFRSYGANIVVTAPQGNGLAADEIATVERVVGPKGIAVPFAYAIARTQNGSPVVVAGADFARVKKLDSYWSVSAWPSAHGEALVGAKAVKLLGPSFTLDFQGHTQTFRTAGTVQTGADEDSRVFVDLADFQRWTGLEPSTLEVAAGGSPQEIEATLRALTASLPGLEVRPVRQMVEGEAHVLGKTRAALLASIAVIILTAILCVISTLTAWVMDRRRDFAIMKALGASNRTINGFFAAQAVALGAVGALAGFALGLGVAAWIGQANFHSAVSPRWNVLPVVMAGSIAVALLSAMLPMALLRRVQAATILRGE